MKTKLLLAVVSFVAGGSAVVLAVASGHAKINEKGFVFDSKKL